MLKFNLVKFIVGLASIAAAASAYASQFPPEIYRAKTVFLSCWTSILNECKIPHVMEGIQQQIASGNRWTVVTEPAQADLILVFFEDESNSQSALGRVTIYNSSRFAGLVVLKGGATPDWDAVPLYATGGRNAFAAFHEFHDAVIRTAPLFTMPSALLPSASKKHVVRWGRSIAEYTEILIDEPGNVDAYYARGWAYRQSGDLDNAIRDFTMAVRLRPGFEEAQRELASAKKAKAFAECHYQLGCPK